MNQDQINITGMHSTVASYMTKNQAIWVGNKAVGGSMTQLTANNGVIAQKRDVQETSTEGQAALALQAKTALEEKILEIGDQIYALAVKNNDVVTQAQSHFTLSSLDGMDPDKLQQTGKDVSALTTANLTALADYGVVAADVTELGQLTDDFGAKKKALQTAKSTRSGQTKTLPQAISDNQSLLRKQLDKQITKFKKTNPDFYAGYLTARVIANRRSHHASPAPAPAPAAQTKTQK